MGRDFFGNLPIVAGMGYMRGIMVLEDCEGTFTWVIDGTGGDQVAEFLAAAAWQGAYGLHLKTRTTDTTHNDMTQAQKLFDYPASGLLIARLRVATLNVANTDAFYLGLRIDDGAQQYLGNLVLDIVGAAVKYQDSAGAYQALAALACTYTAGQWYTLELAIDCRSKKYLHVRFNGLEADLSAYGLYNDAASSGRSALVTLTVQASAAGPGEVYADNILVTEIPEA